MNDIIPNRKTHTIDDETWELYKTRFEVLSSLLDQAVLGHNDVDEAAIRLKLSRRQIYRLIDKLRSGEGILSDLIHEGSNGGKGKGRIADQVEQIVLDCIQKHFLKNQKISIRCEPWRAEREGE
jgi:putative transposase